MGITLKNITRLVSDSTQCAIALLSGSAIAVVGTLLMTTSPASAQAAYGSYVGVGPSFGLTEGDFASQDNAFGAVIAGRYKFLEIPLSLRSQVFLSDESWAVAPTASLDIPLDWQTDVYVGAGFSIVSGSQATPIGDKSSFIIQPGIDHMLPQTNLVLFGNAVIAFDGYEEGGTAASLQGGVGVRF